MSDSESPHGPGVDEQRQKADAYAAKLNARVPAGVDRDRFTPSQTFRADEDGKIKVRPRSVVNPDRQEKKALKKTGLSARQIRKRARGVRLPSESRATEEGRP